MKKILALPICLLSLSSLFGAEVLSTARGSQPSNSSRASFGQDNFSSEYFQDVDLAIKGSSTAPTPPSQSTKKAFYEPNSELYRNGNGPLRSTDGSNRTKLEKLKDAAGKVGTNLKNSAFYVPRQVKESYQLLKDKFFLDKNNKLRRDRDYTKYNHNLNRVDVFNDNHNLTKGERAKVAATKVGLAAAAPLHAAARGAVAAGRGAVAAGKGVVDAAKWVKNKIRPAARN